MLLATSIDHYVALNQAAFIERQSIFREPPICGQRTNFLGHSHAAHNILLYPWNLTADDKNEVTRNHDPPDIRHTSAEGWHAVKKGIVQVLTRRRIGSSAGYVDIALHDPLPALWIVLSNNISLISTNGLLTTARFFPTILNSRQHVSHSYLAVATNAVSPDLKYEA